MRLRRRYAHLEESEGRATEQVKRSVVMVEQAQLEQTQVQHAVLTHCRLPPTNLHSITAVSMVVTLLQVYQWSSIFNVQNVKGPMLY